MAGHLTVPEKLLAAALKLRETKKRFSAEDLVMAAWTMFPDTFGLSGYADAHPDSNRVLTQIMGTKGMRGKGWLRKVGEKQYSLTAKALTDGEVLHQRTEGASPERSGYLRGQLQREVAGKLARMLSTTAARKALEGVASSDISFTEACGFWDVTARSSANTLSYKLQETEAVLAEAKEATRSQGISVNTMNLSAAQIDRLTAAHNEMKERFREDLDVIRARKDERLLRRRS